jgi:ketosteroid isomerase-like protein
MPRADQSTLDFLTEYFAVMEAKDYDRLADFFADDVSLTFANAPTVTGKDVVLAQLAGIGDKVNSLAHPLINVWQEEDGVVVFEADSVWRFPDGFETTIRACSIFTIADQKFTDQRIYVDNSPIGSRLA